MSDTQAKVPPGQRCLKIGMRIAAFLLMAALIGAILNRVSGSLESNSRPAGFVRGVLQGALMPMSLPNLLVGRDVTIYSLNNTGVSYKLGYTTGVNACGALFFGVVFWRVGRLRKWARDPKADV